eukprot:6565293-Prymnesium_polylepis.1
MAHAHASQSHVNAASVRVAPAPLHTRREAPSYVCPLDAPSSVSYDGAHERCSPTVPVASDDAGCDVWNRFSQGF